MDREQEHLWAVQNEINNTLSAALIAQIDALNALCRALGIDIEKGIVLAEAEDILKGDD